MRSFYTVNFHCKNMTALGQYDGMLDLTKTRQPFIYAAGPTDKSLATTDKAAGLRRHEAYGSFWMDMTLATSVEGENAAVPNGTALRATVSAGADGEATNDGDTMGSAHAVLMCGAFALVFPLGTVLLRVLESVKVHGIVQAVGAVAALAGSGVGVHLSMTYNHVSSSVIRASGVIAC
jgi:hypothetical protein